MFLCFRYFVTFSMEAFFNCFLYGTSFCLTHCFNDVVIHFLSFDRF